jgi:hypothetical protein
VFDYFGICVLEALIDNQYKFSVALMAVEIKKAAVVSQLFYCNGQQENAL